MSASAASTEQELRVVTSDERVTWGILSTATESDINGFITALKLDAFQGAALRNIALRHPDRIGNQCRFRVHFYIFSI